MRSIGKVLSVLLIILCAPLSFAETTSAKNSFQDFLTVFNQTLEKNEKEKIADLSSFPKFNWEEGLGVDVKREVFLKNFEKIFTPEIRNKLKTGKYIPAYGNYFTEWTRGGNSYSLWFNREKDGSYRFSGLYVGPGPGSH